MATTSERIKNRLEQLDAFEVESIREVLKLKSAYVICLGWPTNTKFKSTRIYQSNQ